MPMLDYKRLPPDQAAELHERELARHPTILESLADRFAATAGDPALLDGSIASLVPLWQWYVGWYDAGHAEEPATLPPWFSRGDGPHEVDFPDGLFAVADELGHYLDEVALRSVPGAHWRLVGERHRVQYVDFQRSGVALGGDDMVGPDLAYVMCLRVQNGKNRDERALLETFMTRVAHLDL